MSEIKDASESKEVSESKDVSENKDAGDNKDASDSEKDFNKEDVDDFIKANGVDERAAADLKESTIAVQKAVLARGDLSTARNPSAALLVRIRDARVGNNTGSSS